MCKCCDAIKELKDIEDEQEKMPNIKHILKARLTSITRKKGIKKEIGVINFDSYDLNYCPMCRKEARRVKRYASGYWYQFIIPRRLTLPPTRIYRWLNFFWRLKDKEESYDK